MDFTQISGAWETPDDDWVRHTCSRGVLDSRVVPVGGVLENARDFLALTCPGTE